MITEEAAAHRPLQHVQQGLQLAFKPPETHKQPAQPNTEDQSHSHLDTNVGQPSGQKELPESTAIPSTVRKLSKTWCTLEMNLTLILDSPEKPLQ